MSSSTLTERPNSPNLVLVVDRIEALHSTLHDAGVEIVQKPQVSKWNASEISMMLFDSEDNLILVSSLGS